MSKAVNLPLRSFVFLVAFLMHVMAYAQEFKEVEPFLQKVQPDSIRAHIKFLSDDQLRGRLPGTPGYQRAVDYVISRYKSLGLIPAGENQTFIQTVKLRRAKLNKDETRATFVNATASKDLEFGNDYVVYPNFEEKNVSLTAPLVFAGYGISEPEFGYDDYAGMDVKGKIVVVVSGSPDKFPSTVRAHVMNRNTRIKTALEKGAVGVILRGPPTGLQNQVYSIVNAGAVATVENTVSGLKFYGSVSQQLFGTMLNKTTDEIASVLLSLKEGKPASFELQSSFQLNATTSYADSESQNVIGKILGSDKTLKDEYVVYSAHLDHVGVGTPVKGDSIYNGAHDNASGVSCVMEVARVYSSLKQKPKRSILIVMVTGEEMGLLGSSYFASHPTVPKEKIVANVNMDMPTLIAPLLHVVPLGAVHSSLMNPVKSAAAYVGTAIAEDPEPEQNRFTRSDQYSFVQQGIPALNIRYVEPNGGTEKIKAWRAEFYHQPQDEFLESNFDFDAARKYVQLCFLIGYQVSQNKERPTWNEGDLFGLKFGVKK